MIILKKNYRVHILKALLFCFFKKKKLIVLAITITLTSRRNFYIKVGVSKKTEKPIKLRKREKKTEKPNRKKTN